MKESEVGKEKVLFDIYCFGHSMNNVFLENGELYRGFNNKELNAMYANGLIDELVAKHILTPSNLISSNNDKYLAIVSQPELLPCSDIDELVPSIRRDMGLKFLLLSRILNKYGYTLLEIDVRDFYINQKGQPIFHNLENIIPKGNKKFQYIDFYSLFIGPLRIINESPQLVGLIHRSSNINIEEDISIRHKLLRKILSSLAKLGPLGKKIFEWYRRLFVLSQYSALIHTGKYLVLIRELINEYRSRIRGLSNSDANWINSVWDKLEKELSEYDYSSIGQRWTTYYDHLDLKSIVRANDDWVNYYQGEREQTIINQISDLSDGSLLDVGANNGFFSMLGAHLGFKATAVDYDLGAIDRLYSLLKEENYPLAIRPLVFNFSKIKKQDYTKYCSDVVLALGFAHHMRLVELLSWDIISERLSKLTKKVLITEFKPGTGATHAKEEKTRLNVDDYNLTDFVSALNNYFGSVKVMGDYSDTGFTNKRTMIVCRR